MRTLVILISAVILCSCGSSRQSVKFVFPTGYTGPFKIVLDKSAPASPDGTIRFDKTGVSRANEDLFQAISANGGTDDDCTYEDGTHLRLKVPGDTYPKGSRMIVWEGYSTVTAEHGPGEEPGASESYSGEIVVE